MNCVPFPRVPKNGLPSWSITECERTGNQQGLHLNESNPAVSFQLFCPSLPLTAVGVHCTLTRDPLLHSTPYLKYSIVIYDHGAGYLKGVRL